MVIVTGVSIKIVFVVEAVEQLPDPSGSFVVNVRITVPDSFDPGVYEIEPGVADADVDDKVPVPEVIDQAALEAEPPNEAPVKLTAVGETFLHGVLGVPATILLPAFTVGKGVTTIETVNVLPAQFVEAGPVGVMVNTTV